MILAAGLGTRLKPITDSRPKALVEIEGTPVIARVIHQLKKSGVTQFVVNVHHFADMLETYLGENEWGVDVRISDERASLLDTGGGVVKAAPLLFNEDTDSLALIHNVDILSNADIAGLISRHRESGNDMTLLVSDRNSSRKLVFDSDDRLVGWHNLALGLYRPDNYCHSPFFKEYAFSGIYIVNLGAVNEMKNLMGERPFSIIDYFLNPQRRSVVGAVPQNDLLLLDIGKPATLSQASEILKFID